MTSRTWLITGVSSGFSRHMTEQLLERGDRVAGTVRKMDSKIDLKAKYSGSAVAGPSRRYRHDGDK